MLGQSYSILLYKIVQIWMTIQFCDRTTIQLLYRHGYTGKVSCDYTNEEYTFRGRDSKGGTFRTRKPQSIFYFQGGRTSHQVPRGQKAVRADITNGCH
jgi:hypothetical protein